MWRGALRGAPPLAAAPGARHSCAEHASARTPTHTHARTHLALLLLGVVDERDERRRARGGAAEHTRAAAQPLHAAGAAREAAGVATGGGPGCADAAGAPCRWDQCCAAAPEGGEGQIAGVLHPCVLVEACWSAGYVQSYLGQVLSRGKCCRVGCRTASCALPSLRAAHATLPPAQPALPHGPHAQSGAAHAGGAPLGALHRCV